MSYLTSLWLLRVTVPNRKAIAPLISLVSHERAASSFSAIHDGLRASQRRNDRSFRRNDRTDGRDNKRHSKKSSGIDRMSDDDIRKAIAGESPAGEEESGRKSRRHRFNAEDSEFGKKSLVYMIKNGPLKEKADQILAEKQKKAEDARRRALGLPQEKREDNSFGGEKTFSRRDSGGEWKDRAKREDRDSGRGFSRKESGSWGDKAPREPRSSERREAKPFHHDGRSFDRREPHSAPRSSKGFSDRDGQSFGREPRSTPRPTTGFSDRREPRSTSRVIASFSDHDSQPTYRRDTPSLTSRPTSPFSDRDSTPRDSRPTDSTSRDSYPRDSPPRDTLSSHNRPTARYADRDSQGMYRQDAPSNPLRKTPIMGTPVVPYTTAASQFLFGKSVVKAALRSARRKLYHLYIYAGENRREAPDDAFFITLAKKHNIQWTMVPTDGQPMMDRMSQGRPHNGYVLEASPLPQPPVTHLGEVDANPWARSFGITTGFQTREDELINGKQTHIKYEGPLGQKPLVLFLHEVVDPGNLGGIIRTARFMGAAAVAITKNNSATLTPVVQKAAAGAVEEIPILTVEDPTNFLKKSRKSGWCVLAAVAPDSRNADKIMTPDKLGEVDLLRKNPCLLVLGSEGSGLPKHVRSKADVEVSIPRMAKWSGVDSLNVSVAAGLLCNALLAKRDLAAEAGHADVVAAEVAARVAAEKGEVGEVVGTKDVSGLKAVEDEPKEEKRLF